MGKIDRSKDAGHYEYEIGDKIENYIITSHMGDGTFGRVLEGYHVIKKKKYALKVIRAVKRYTKYAKIEA